MKLQVTESNAKRLPVGTRLLLNQIEPTVLMVVPVTAKGKPTYDMYVFTNYTVKFRAWGKQIIVITGDLANTAPEKPATQKNVTIDLEPI
jgi:hypothetical protein